MKTEQRQAGFRRFLQAVEFKVIFLISGDGRLIFTDKWQVQCSAMLWNGARALFISASQVTNA